MQLTPEEKKVRRNSSGLLDADFSCNNTRKGRILRQTAQLSVDAEKSKQLRNQRRKERQEKARSVTDAKPLLKKAQTSIYVPKKTFGTSLKEQMDAQSSLRNSQVRFDATAPKTMPKAPLIVYKTIEHIRNLGGTKTEGIFRMCGKHQLLNDGRNYIDNEQKSLDEVLNSFDIHTCGDFLKLYLRSLPDNIVPEVVFAHLRNAEQLRMFPPTQMAMKTPTKPVDELYSEYIGAALNCLPPHNHTLFFYVLDFLQEVAKQSEYNKMDPRNLATIFGTIIFGMPDPEDREQFMKENEQRTMILEFLIQFGGDVRNSSTVLQAMEVTKSIKSKKKKQRSLIKGELVYVITQDDEFVYLWVATNLEVYPVSVLSSMIVKSNSELQLLNQSAPEPSHGTPENESDSPGVIIVSRVPVKRLNTRRRSMTGFVNL